MKYGAHIMKCIWVAILVVLAGCGGTYSPPRTSKQVLTRKIQADKSKIYRATMHVLRRAGYRFAFADMVEGRITTRPKTTRLTSKDCDCGMALGTGFASDPRTTTDVSYFVIVRDNEFSVRSIIDGQYVASDTSTVRRFQCVSRGGLEKDVAGKIIDELAAIEIQRSGASEPKELPPETTKPEEDPPAEAEE